MAPRKSNPTDALHDAFMASVRPADAARVINAPGKALRDVLRKQGTYVSKGAAFDDNAKSALWDSTFVQKRVAILNESK